MTIFRKHDGTDLVPLMTATRLSALDSRDFSLDDIDARRKAIRFRERESNRSELKKRLATETDNIIKELGLDYMPTLEDIKRIKREAKENENG